MPASPLRPLPGSSTPALLVRTGPAGFAVVLAGAFLHIAMDLPATPGLPLLAPASDKKYALFILPGPSIFLMAVSLFFLIWMALGVVTLAEGMVAYGAILVLFLLVRFAAFLVSRPALRGTMWAIPQVNPLRWLAIYESGDAWTARDYRIGLGMTDPVSYPEIQKYKPERGRPCSALPEVQRLRYHSYIVTAEKEDGSIIFSDPLRVSGRIFYPPHFKQVRIAYGGAGHGMIC